MGSVFSVSEVIFLIIKLICSLSVYLSVQKYLKHAVQAFPIISSSPGLTAAN